VLSPTQQTLYQTTFTAKNKLHLAQSNVNAKLANPLAGIPHAKLEEQLVIFSISADRAPS
jgi:hypothetical protein